jgi:hypothetical protein
MHTITEGPNDIYFTTERDLPYFSPTSRFYGLSVMSFDGAGKEKMLLVQDVSPSPRSYQLFRVTGSTTGDDLANGVIDLRPGGKRHFTLFPSSGSSLSDVDRTSLCNGLIQMNL